MGGGEGGGGRDHYLMISNKILNQSEIKVKVQSFVTVTSFIYLGATVSDDAQNLRFS